MSIGRCSRVTGKMFAATRNPLPSHCFVEGSGISPNLIDGFAVASAPQRMLSVIIKRNVEHRTKIEIETEKAQQTPRDIAVAPDEIDVVLVAQLLCVRRFISDQAQSRDASAFLIDRDDWLDVAQVAQIIDKLSQLRRALEVASKQNVCPRLHAPKQT